MIAALAALVGLAAGSAVTLLQPTQALASSCGTHLSIHGRDGGLVMRGGTGIGVLAGSGMWLGSTSSSLNCIRVSSIFSWHDSDNFEELGAIADVSSIVTCLSGAGLPHDGQWYRYWYEEVATHVYCTSVFIHEGDNHWHVVQVYRDTNNRSNWHMYWDGSWVLLTAPTVTAGYALGGTERWNSSDSAYGKFGEADYMDASDSWHPWPSLAVWDDNDPGYGLSGNPTLFEVCSGC